LRVNREGEGLQIKGRIEDEGGEDDNEKEGAK
jgi:hypothetical protein